MVLTDHFVLHFKHVDANGGSLPRCSKSHEELPHFSCTAVNNRTDVNFDMLDHGKVFFGKREHWLAEISVVESKSVLPVEYWQSFLVESPTGSEDTGEDVIFLAVGSAARVAWESIGLESSVWVNQELLVDFHTKFWQQRECGLVAGILTCGGLVGRHH